MLRGGQTPRPVNQQYEFPLLDTFHVQPWHKITAAFGTQADITGVGVRAGAAPSAATRAYQAGLRAWPAS